MNSVTRSPCVTPRRASAAASRSVRSSSSRYVTVRSPSTRAGLAPTSRATSRRRSCSAISRYVNVAGRAAVTVMAFPPFLERADSTRALDDGLRLLLVELAEPRRPQHLAHDLVVRNAGEEMVAAGRDVFAGRPFFPLQLDVRALVVRGEALEELAEGVAHRVLRGERDEDEPVAEVAELTEAGGVRLVEPLERARPVERERRVREAAVHLFGETLGRAAVRVRELGPHEVGRAALEIAQRAVDREIQPARRLGRVDRRDRVGPRDDDEVRPAEVRGDGLRHPELADHLVGGDERLAGDVTAALGKDLVLEVRAGEARVHIELGRALDVEQVPVAAVHVDDDRRGREGARRDPRFWGAQGPPEV